jgi:uncharacterized protein (TIGR03437 family)
LTDSADCATVNVISANGTQTATNIQVAAQAPAIFTLNGSGLAAAYAMGASATGAQTVEPAYQTTSGASLAASPISVASPQTYLVLFTTGMDTATISLVTVTVTGVNAQVVYVGPVGGGLDQVNVLSPASLAGKGTVEIQLTSNGVSANPAQIVIL